MEPHASKGHSVVAILLAGGQSARFTASNQKGANKQPLPIDKLQATLNGQPVLYHSLKALLSIEAIQALVVVCPAERQPVYEAILDNAFRAMGKPPLYKPHWARAGSTRRESVWNGLEQVPSGTEWVLVHDAARPLIQPATITAMLDAFDGMGGLTVAQPVVDTIKQVQPDASVKTLERQSLWAVQTPQLFGYDTLLQAHRLVANEVPVTDDCQLIEISQLGPTRFYPSSTPNPKITTSQDVEWVNYLMKSC